MSRENKRPHSGLGRSKELGIQSCCTVQKPVKRIGVMENPSSRTEWAQSYKPNYSEKTDSQKPVELPETKPGIEELFIRKGSIRS